MFLSRNILFTVILVIFCRMVVYTQENKLESIQKETKKEAKTSNNTNSSNNTSSSNHSSNQQSYESYDEDEGSIFAVFNVFYYLFKCVSYVYVGPYKGLEDDYDMPMYFLKSPYDLENEGYLSFSDNNSKNIVFEASFKYKYFLDDIQAYCLDANMRTSARLELSLNYNYLIERRSDGEYDEMQLGDCNLLIRFAQNEKCFFKSGLGINKLEGKYTDVYGVNFNYSVDIYPKKPIHFAFSFDVGNIGDATKVKLSGLLGFVIKNCEANLGIDFYSIEDETLLGGYAGFTLYF